jgi:hypothetical protein
MRVTKTRALKHGKILPGSTGEERVRNSGIVIIVALALMLSVSAAGQPDRVIDLPVEPVRSPITNSLADAARRHDFPTFDSMYRTAVSRTSVAAFEELHSLWTWAMTDPIGAFYGQQRYERYVRMFPHYARFIEEYRIVDSNGNSFFPTAETRRFLLEQALNGAPVTRVAAAAAPGVGAVESVASPVPVKVQSPDHGPAEAGPYVVPAVEQKVARAHLLPRAAESQVAKPAHVAAVPQSVVPRTDGPAEASPYVGSPAEARVAKPEVVVPQTLVSRADGPGRSAPDRSGLGRGIFLIIAGLLGVGMLTMMIETPATRS